MIYRPGSGDYVPVEIPEIADTVELWKVFQAGFPSYLKEMAVSLLPIVVFFFLFQMIFRLVPGKSLVKISVGLIYTYVGLVLFLTGVNVGFMPAGNYLGRVIAGLPYRWIIVPIGMLIGYFIVLAEPAVFVLTKQVEEITDGAISAKAMSMSLSIGVSVSLGLAAVGGDIIADAFGVVAMVAMTPLITIQILGLVFRLRAGKAEIGQAGIAAVAADAAGWGDYDIIDL